MSYSCCQILSFCWFFSASTKQSGFGSFFRLWRSVHHRPCERSAEVSWLQPWLQLWGTDGAITPPNRLESFHSRTCWMLFYDEITNHGKRRSSTTPPILRAGFSTMMEEDGDSSCAALLMPTVPNLFTRTVPPRSTTDCLSVLFKGKAHVEVLSTFETDTFFYKT